MLRYREVTNGIGIGYHWVTLSNLEDITYNLYHGNLTKPNIR